MFVMVPWVFEQESILLGLIQVDLNFCTLSKSNCTTIQKYRGCVQCMGIALDVLICLCMINCRRIV